MLKVMEHFIVERLKCQIDSQIQVAQIAPSNDSHR